MNYSGVVSKLSSFDYQGKKLWSFQLQNARNYFRVGQRQPSFAEGAFVEFDGEPDAKGNVNLKLDAITVKEGKPEITGLKNFRTAAASSTPREMTSNGFWEAKTERDIETQKRIEIQSCRNSALQFIDLLNKAEALKIPAKNKLEFLEALLEHYIGEFQKRNKGEVIVVSTPEVVEE